MLFGVLDCSGSVFRFSNAGHEAPLLYRADTGTFEVHDAAGLPLGVTADVEYGLCGETHLRPGDILVLYTDGVWEALNAKNETFGRPAVQEIIAASGALPAMDVAQSIADAVSAFCGDVRPHDDMTVAVLKCLPSD